MILTSFGPNTSAALTTDMSVSLCSSQRSNFSMLGHFLTIAITPGSVRPSLFLRLIEVSAVEEMDLSPSLVSFFNLWRFSSSVFVKIFANDVMPASEEK